MQKDYILRIIEQFVKALAAIISSRRAGNYEKAFEQIQHTCQSYLDADILTFLNHTPDQLLNQFRRGSDSLDTEKCILCADLIYEVALICDAKHQYDTSLRLKALSLHLFLAAIPKDPQFQTQKYLEKTQQILEELDEEFLPEGVSENLKH